jgi:DCC1-like thiol-disulfide oxidoreductase
MDNSNENILLFDGVCNLCNGMVRFIIKRDTVGKFRFASLQSETGQLWLERFGLLGNEKDPKDPKDPKKDPKTDPKDPKKDPSSNVNPSTLHRNAFGHNYTGWRNPTDFRGIANFDAPPTCLPDLWSEYHDIDYMTVKESGWEGMAFSFKTIPADYKLIYRDLGTAGLPFVPLKTRIQAGTIGFFVFAATLTKTAYSAMIFSTTGYIPWY